MADSSVLAEIPTYRHWCPSSSHAMHSVGYLHLPPGDCQLKLLISSLCCHPLYNPHIGYLSSTESVEAYTERTSPSQGLLSTLETTSKLPHEGENQVAHVYGLDSHKDPPEAGLDQSLEPHPSSPRAAHTPPWSLEWDGSVLKHMGHKPSTYHPKS